VPADPEDNRPPDEDILWNNEEKKDMMDKAADVNEANGNWLGQAGRDLHPLAFETQKVSP